MPLTAMLKIILLILALSISSFAQKWELVGTSTENPYKIPVAYYVDMNSITTKGTETRFTGVMTGLDDSGDSFVISTTYLIIFTDFSVNCATLQWKELTRRGSDERTLINEVIEKPITREAGAGSVIYGVMQKVCPKPKPIGKLSAYINF
jgi:hypothetical protein